MTILQGFINISSALSPKVVKHLVPGRWSRGSEARLVDRGLRWAASAEGLVTSQFQWIILRKGPYISYIRGLFWTKKHRLSYDTSLISNKMLFEAGSLLRAQPVWWNLLSTCCVQRLRWRRVSENGASPRHGR